MVKIKKYFQMQTKMIALSNYQWGRNLSQYFKTLQQQDSSQDVLIFGDDKTMLRAHKFVLQIGSLFFREVTENLPLNCTGNGSQLWYVRGADSVILDNILKFLYTGHTTVAQECITLCACAQCKNQL